MADAGVVEKLELAQELLGMEGAERASQAARLAREALEALPKGANREERALAHSVLGRALFETAEPSRAVGHLEEALQLLLPDTPTHLRVQTRMVLAKAYALLARRDDAFAQLTRAVEDARAAALTAPLALATLLLAEMERSAGNTQRWRERLRAVEREVAGTPWEHVLLLERLFPIHGEPLAGEVLELMRRFGEGLLPVNAALEQQLAILLMNHAEQLPADIRRKVLDGQQRPRLEPPVRARLLAAEGRVSEAVTLLQGELLKETSDAERLRSAGLLLALLPDEALDERLRTCEVVEKLLTGPLDDSAMRSDLAAAFWKCARGERRLLDRAWRHAELAAKGLAGNPVALEVNARVLANIRMEQLASGSVTSTPEQISLATWFEQSLPLPARELARYRQEAAAILLHPGPFTLPRAVAIAERLLGLVPDSGGARAIRARLDWVRARSAPSPQEGALVQEVLAGAGGVNGPFDGAPSWVVALAQGLRAPPASSLGDGALTELGALMRARPDRAEECLDWMFQGISHGSSEDHDVLAMLSALGPSGAVGPRLLERLERAISRSPGFPLLRLKVQLLSQSMGWGDGTPYTRAADALVAAARTPEERIEASFFKGVERLNALQVLSPFDGRRRGILDEARQILSQAVGEAGLARVPGHLRFALFIAAGNAFREGHSPDIEQALRMYEEARSIGAPNPFEAAKLSKVTADALLLRRGPGDAAQAMHLLEHSLGIRKGTPYYAETLMTAARAELMQTERSEEERLRRASDRLEEALLHCDEGNQLGLAWELVGVIAQLIRYRPRDVALHQRLDELGRLHPKLAQEAERAKRGQVGPLPEDMARFAQASAMHPAVVAYFEGTRPLKRSEELIAEMGLEPDSPMAKVVRAADTPAEECTPEALTALAARLSQVGEPANRPGALAARAKLLAHLAGLRQASAEAARRAAEEAEPLVRAIELPAARHLLLLELARFWVPMETYIHPVVDCARGAKLCREVLDDPTVTDAESLDALQCFARATRYRKDGDRLAHLREAARLYEECARRYEQVGMADGAAIMRTNLAEVRAELRTGGSEPEHFVGVSAARERLALARSPSEKAIAQGNLAVELTRLGSLRPPPEGDALLAEARRLFESMPWGDLSVRRFSVENFQTICLVEIATRAGQRAEAIELWRKRLAGLDREAHPVEWAMTVHNLADTLIGPDRQTGTMDTRQVTEGLLLCEEALKVRTLEEFPEFHWETADTMGRGIVAVLLNWSASLPWPRELWERGEQALRGAIKAAQMRGGGERLAKSALSLLRLALAAGSPEQLESTAELAWAALDGARPFLLVDEMAGFQEAVHAADVGATLGRALAARAAVGSTEGFQYVLAGDSAERVLRWLARASGAAQRALAGRTSRPTHVPPEDWVEWLEAVRNGASGDVARALEKLRFAEPSFLQGEPDLSGTWSWLRSRPGSAAVALVGSNQELMAAVLEHAEQPRVLVAAIRADSLPVGEDAVAQGLSADDSGQPYRELLTWTRTNLLPPLQRLLPSSPSHLLWMPAGPLRLLAPADLWPTIPVTLATRLDLEVRSYPERPRCTLLAVADPGPGRRGELKSAVKVGAQLTQLIASAGATRALLSQGSKFGTALRLSCPGLVDRPASAGDVLRELAEADVVMFLCHGGVAGPRNATLQLLDERGSDSELVLEQVGAEPRRIAGATVVLLSCETGRVGDWLHRAAGLAGAFLASGARQIIAPLWEVRLGAALQVGRAVLDALGRGADPSLAIHALRVQDAQAGGASSGYSGRAWSLKAFVHWVG
ncbi:CHAT domain-containing protein [Myxococcus fulvus]|uniref:CHAT domain-containing protein n=1 Tax=Myxococcus fulvus TaxID=33 RepID=UPI0020C1371E|nr:CHAT domain-containing protein [Myxococcus fulvus]MCK8498034.1 CHAT domain-containing protein [Myxococcus fulvus]